MTCWCGTFAVGKCRGCNQAACLDHSTLAGSRGRLCDSCAALPAGSAPNEAKAARTEQRRSERGSRGPRGTFPLRSSEERAEQSLAARSLAERFVTAMNAAGNPGTEQWGSRSGWVVGTQQSTAVHPNPDARNSPGVMPGGRRTLVLLTDGRLGVLETRRGVERKRWRDRQEEWVEVGALSAGPYMLPRVGSPDAVNPWFQLLTSLPAIAEQNGVELG